MRLVLLKTWESSALIGAWHPSCILTFSDFKREYQFEALSKRKLAIGYSKAPFPSVRDWNYFFFVWPNPHFWPMAGTSNMNFYFNNILDFESRRPFFDNFFRLRVNKFLAMGWSLINQTFMSGDFSFFKIIHFLQGQIIHIWALFLNSQLMKITWMFCLYLAKIMVNCVYGKFEFNRVKTAIIIF